MFDWLNLRSLWFVILTWILGVLGLGVPSLGCAGTISDIEASNSTSSVSFPGSAIGEEGDFHVSSNPNTDLWVEAWYPDGQRKFRLERRRSYVVNALGEQIERVESGRSNNVIDIGNAAIGWAQQGAAIYSGLRPAPPPSQPSQPSAGNDALSVLEWLKANGFLTPRPAGP